MNAVQHMPIPANGLRAIMFAFLMEALNNYLRRNEWSRALTFIERLESHHGLLNVNDGVFLDWKRSTLLMINICFDAVALPHTRASIRREVCLRALIRKLSDCGAYRPQSIVDDLSDPVYPHDEGILLYLADHNREFNDGDANFVIFDDESLRLWHTLTLHETWIRFNTECDNRHFYDFRVGDVAVVGVAQIGGPDLTPDEKEAADRAYIEGSPDDRVLFDDAIAGIPGIPGID